MQIERKIDDDDCLLDAFEETGLVKNTQKSRNTWGKKFETFLESRKVTLSEMNDNAVLAENLRRFYYCIKQDTGILIKYLLCALLSVHYQHI